MARINLREMNFMLHLFGRDSVVSSAGACRSCALQDINTPKLIRHAPTHRVRGRRCCPRSWARVAGGECLRAQSRRLTHILGPLASNLRAFLPHQHVQTTQIYLDATLAMKDSFASTWTNCRTSPHVYSLFARESHTAR
jgi:hypothetical protein